MPLINSENGKVLSSILQSYTSANQSFSISNSVYLYNSAHIKENKARKNQIINLPNSLNNLTLRKNEYYEVLFKHHPWLLKIFDLVICITPLGGLCVDLSVLFCGDFSPLMCPNNRLSNFLVWRYFGTFLNIISSFFSTSSNNMDAKLNINEELKNDFWRYFL